MTGTIPTPALLPLPNQFKPILAGQPAVIPPQAMPGSPNSPYLQPAFHALSHSDMLYNNPFSPFDLPNMRGIPMNARPSLSISHQLNTSFESQTSDNSWSSPDIGHHGSDGSRPSSVHSDRNSSFKLNNSLESEDFDDEEIDVEVSTFAPIMRPNVHLTVELSDSHVSDREMYPILRARCEMKAPSALRPDHKRAPIEPRSPETKIKLSTTQKTVWRPY